MRGVSIVGLVAAAFGPAYSWLLLRLLYSTRWADTGAPAALGAYAGYIVLLAVNGILEACAVSRGPSESSQSRPQCVPNRKLLHRLLPVRSGSCQEPINSEGTIWEVVGAEHFWRSTVGQCTMQCAICPFRPTVLSACVRVPVTCLTWMAGGAQAFVHAAADSRQLVRINMVLIAFAAAHMALSIALVGPGGALLSLIHI